SGILGTAAAEVIGVDANPEAFEHASAKYTTDRVTFRRELVESFSEPRDAIVFLQTIEHVQDPDSLVAGFAKTAPVAYISTPNLLTLAPEGAEKSDNPWHIKEYRLEEFRALLEPHFARVEILGLHHAGKLKVHELALSLGWDRVHKSLGLSKPFYDRFTPAIDASDFRLSNHNLESSLDFLAVCHV
ncbi:MAG TPA: methyltransferase domain-containing protein, partial [Solirubrobacterales bacterium]|nr:methyltransferase domain-containing protein [Solirubrobacterales bacterium]